MSLRLRLALSIATLGSSATAASAGVQNPTGKSCFSMKLFNTRLRIHIIFVRFFSRRQMGSNVREGVFETFEKEV